MMFSFTSMGGKIDHSINSGGAPYIFRLHRANYHEIGSLLHERGKQPKFSQLGERENDNSRRFDDVIVEELRRMID
ncbi:hypothetical protein ACS0TY_034029 [Phlomoides rotata]